MKAVRNFDTHTARSMSSTYLVRIIWHRFRFNDDEQVLLGQHKNHYEQMCVIFMRPLNFSLLSLAHFWIRMTDGDCMQLIEK